MQFRRSIAHFRPTVVDPGRFVGAVLGVTALLLSLSVVVPATAQPIHGTVTSVSANTVRVELADSIAVPDESDGRIVEERSVGGRTVQMSFALVTVERVRMSGDAPWVAICEIQRRSRDIDVGDGVRFEQAEVRSTLAVETEPAGASVTVGDRQLGRTPLRAQLRSGTYSVSLNREGYFTETQSVTVSPGEERTLDVSMRESQGTLVVNTLPEDAIVSLRERDVGRTPLETEVQTGTDTLTIQREGYLPVVRVVNIEKNEETRLNVTLQRPLNVRLASEQGEAVENAQVQRDGGQLVVEYDLVGGSEKYTVDLLLSTNDGKTFEALPRTVQGEIGKDIAPGSDKKIVWAALEDFPEGLRGKSNRLRVVTDAQGGRNLLWIVGSAVVAGGGATAAALLGVFGGGDGTGEGDLPDSPPAPPN